MRIIVLLVVTLFILLVAVTLMSADRNSMTTDEAKMRPRGTAVPSKAVEPQAPANPAASSVSAASPMTGEQIKWQVVSSGGSRSTSTNYVLSGTVGQTATGLGSSTNYKLNQGFWQNFGGGGCCTGTTGNVDGDSGDIVDISDLSAMVDYLFFGGAISGCPNENDVDGSASVDISDLTVLVDFLFFGGALPDCP